VNDPDIPRRPVLPRIVFLGRSDEEYRRLWGFGPEDLIGRRVLDCPCGPAGFVAACRTAGVEAFGCDPVLALEPEAIRRRGERDRLETAAALAARDPALAGGDPEAWHREKARSLEAFLEDFATHGPGGASADGRYVAAGLPHLPFEDRSFDLVLSAHLLFTYASIEQGGLVGAAESLDVEFHLAAVDELVRVTAAELRLFPVYAHDPSHPRPHALLELVRDRLQDLGLTTELVRSEYDQGVADVPDTLIARRDGMSAVV